MIRLRMILQQLLTKKVIKLIVGLGNPGQQYKKNRHNTGFLVLDRLVESCGGTWSLHESKFQGHVANCVVGQNKVIMLKPQTFMNNSGMSVAAASRFYKIEIEEILIVHDELDLSPGVVKLKKGGGHAGHNGLRDIIAHQGGRDFYRVRIGVGHPGEKKGVAEYVLSNPSTKEYGLISDACNVIEQKLEALVFGDMALCMNEINQS